jgi:hypothetical protein
MIFVHFVHHFSLDKSHNLCYNEILARNQAECARQRATQKAGLPPYFLTIFMTLPWLRLSMMRSDALALPA